MTQQLHIHNVPFLCVEPGPATIKPTTIVCIAEPLVVVLPIVVFEESIYSALETDTLPLFILAHTVELRGPPTGVMYA